MRTLILSIDDLHSNPGKASSSIGVLDGKDEKDLAYAEVFLSNNISGYRTESFMKNYHSLLMQRSSSISKSDLDNFSYYEDNMIIRFDGFMREYNNLVFLENGQIGKNDYGYNTFNLFYDAFKDLKTNHPEVKNIIIDDSLNSGGDLTTLIEVAGFLMGEVKFSIKETLTGMVISNSYKVDTNYDGVYDENDFQAKGYNVYLLSSSCSFSCGNLLPMVIKDNNAGTIIGQTSGGGSCVVLPSTTALGDFFQISGNFKIGTCSDGYFNSNDNGIRPDKFISTSDYYDLSKLVAYLK